MNKVHFNYTVHSTDPVTGKKFISRACRGLNVANIIAMKALSEGKINVNIEVTKSENNDDGNDDPWSCLTIKDAAFLAA